jgi:hypothetical protein
MVAEAKNPFALMNLLPAGIVLVTLSILEDRKFILTAEDGWEEFDTPCFLSRVICPEDDALIRELDFLVNQKFIVATCRLRPVKEKSMLFIRIYMIPFDLANVQGRLRVRDEAIMVPARKYLKVLLPRIIQDHSHWDARGSSSTGSTKLFFPQTIVNCFYRTKRCIEFSFADRIIAQWPKFIVIFLLQSSNRK